jgi:hypothetical protein
VIQYNKEGKVMGVKRKIALCVFAAHFLLALFLSFDWHFLDGGYFGFFPTFALLYTLSFPLVVSLLTIASFIVLLIKRRVTRFDIATFVLGIIGGLAYLLPPLDLLKAPVTGFLYILVPCSVLAIFVLTIAKCAYLKKGR